MRGANLQAATLREAIFRSVTIQYANLAVVQAVGTDFNGANLTGSNLSGANLQGSRLSMANLSNTNLSGANLLDATLSGANVEGIKFDETTTWPDGKTGSRAKPADYV